MKSILIAVCLIVAGVCCSMTYAGEEVSVVVENAPAVQVSQAPPITISQTYTPASQISVRYEDRLSTIQVPTTVMVDQQVNERVAIVEIPLSQGQLTQSYQPTRSYQQVQATGCPTCQTSVDVRSNTATDVSIGIGDGGRKGLFARLRECLGSRRNNSLGRSR